MALAGAADAPPPDPLDVIHSGSFATNGAGGLTAKILNWNIDRGQHFKGIVSAMRDTHPDICIFQEVDLGARRTKGEDVASDLARTFGMNYTFAPEFRELGQSTAQGEAYHGQAILTRFPIRASRILRFTHQSGFWKPRPLLISSIPLLQRRIGGRIALVNELDRNGGTLVVYNLHLESKTTEHGRLLQLDEVLADAERYPAGTPVMIAGDLNTMYLHSPLITRMRQAGFTSCFGDRRIRTHILIGALDWVFVKGPMTCEGAAVRRDIHASDHFPISAELRF
ncbi:MAG TPA: endonuclease/exonuclease/phosphatase family protein [Bryobacteraceae bacterium]|nr:endonuclease/exonuclease/phosphatase family protein [Bryobacteraceae bacterium]